ncbi:MAG TPA: DNA translocase FtsK 4TM domain-containing protein [Acidimicrobiia bacterium]|nr:DNA translocase FtsK 4TM domain-containing protein [Acidimicrobiia bacterium]
MATKTRSARPTRPAAPARSKRRPAARRSRPARPARVPGRLRTELADQLGGHTTDVVAISFAVLGALSALAMVSDVTGPVGRAIDTAGAVSLGIGRGLVPLALFVAAGLLVGNRDAARPIAVRVGAGATVLVLAVAGLVHLAHGSPDSSALEPLRDAGGVLGALVATPLRAAVGTAGAALVLAAVVFVGVLLVIGSRLGEVGHAIAVALRWIGARLRTLVELPSQQAGAPAPSAELYDQLADDTDFDDEPARVRATLEAAAALVEQPVLDLALEEELDDEDEYEDEDEYDDDEYVAEADEPEFTGLADDDEDDDDVVTPTTTLVPASDHTAWKLPPSTLLKRSNQREVDRRLVDAGGEVLESTLREFGVDARLVGATIGPTVTRYELELAPGVKVNRVTGLAHDIAYAMASPDVRILAPIPGRSAIGVEVPNKQRQLVTLGDILCADEADEAVHPLEVGLGRDISGRAMMLNLAHMPHLLIAGATGAGKSSCINSIITSLLMRTTPDEVRLILVDPKRVELGGYNGLPHLLTEVVTNPKKAANALDWAVREMDMRYDLLAEVGVRDITGYNAMYDRGDLPSADDPDPITGKAYERLPFILIVVDELNDLMMVAARDVETSICRIAQMARAVGIHLVIATQRPSVDVITGVIKANVPSRLAFSVSSLSDSRVILDQPGAEKLIGKGDLLMMTASSSRAQRVQGSWVDEECVRKVVAHWRRQVLAPTYVEGIQGDDSAAGPGGVADDESDELLDEAMELVVRSGLGSTSMLQRKLRVGFSRAGRLMDLLERKGVVGPSEGSKARAVLMTVDEFEAVRPRT